MASGNSANNETVNLAQVGIGYWGKNLLRNFSSMGNVRVLYACDQRGDVRARLETQYPDTKVIPDFETALADPAVHAAVIATETPLHYPLAKAALLAGKHAFIEKPMTQTAAEANELVEIADERRLQIMVGHLLLYHPAFKYLEDTIRAGELGDVYYLYSTRVNLGIIRQKENAFESLAPHDLAVALRFLDERPVGVSATGQSYLQPGIEDIVFSTVFFESGKIAHLHTSWLDPHKTRKVTVVGSKKMAVVDDMESINKVMLYDKGVNIEPGEERYAEYGPSMRLRTGAIHIPKIDSSEPLLKECEHFVDCVQANRSPISDGRSGLDVVRILEAAQASLEQGGRRIALA